MTGIPIVIGTLETVVTVLTSIERCVMLIMKSGKRQTTEGIELPNQESIRILRENSWKYWKRILLNRDEKRKKKRKKKEKSTSKKKKKGKEKNQSKNKQTKDKTKNSKNKKPKTDEVLQSKFHHRIKHLCCPLYKILWTIPRIYKGGTRTKKPKDKETDDYAPEI